MSIYFTQNFQRGFGTFPLKGADAQKAVEAAIATGFRAIDTAQMYANEAEVGAGIAASGVDRGQLCLTTKVPPANFTADAFLPSVEQSIKALGSVPDVLLLHWPPADGDVRPSLELLKEAKSQGLAHNIGVSNYTIAMLKVALDVLGEAPACNQVEFHPLVDQSTLLAGASALGVPLTAYCAVARGRVFDVPLFAEIGAAHGTTAAQVVQRWILQKGVAVNTMSTKPANMASNYDVMGFTLSGVEMAKIDAIGSAAGRIVDSAIVPWAPQWDV